MSKILFLSQPALGHVNPLLNIALQLKEEGHDVRFLIPGVKNYDTKIKILQNLTAAPEHVENAGIRADVVKPHIKLLLKAPLIPLTKGLKEMHFVAGVFSDGLPYYTKKLLDYFQEWQPDAIVHEYLFFAANIAADLEKIPYVCVYHTGLPFYGPQVPPFASGLEITAETSPEKEKLIAQEKKFLPKVDAKINAARAHFGLEPLASNILRRPYSSWLNLVLSHEKIEAERSQLGENTLYIGPSFSKRKDIEAGDFPFDKLDKTKYKVYVSLGTIFNNKPQIFRKIMNALDNDVYQVIISGGGAFKTLQKGKVPANCLLFESVPQVDLLPEIDLFITHGGNNSTNEALKAGKPLVVLPVGGEQNDNRQKIEHIQAGLGFDIDDFDKEDIAENIEAIRENKIFSDTAARAQKYFAETDAPLTSARLICWLIENKKPFQRKKSLPYTITKHNFNEYLR